MPDSHLVSVVVPVHNGGEYLEESVKSALQQNYSPLEIIVVDDGSTDRTPDVLRRFGTAVKALRQENAGAAAARNRALEVAHGEFIAFLDADDLWHPDKLRTQVQYLLDHQDVDLVASRWKVLADDEAADQLGDSVDSAASRTVDDGHSGWLYNDLLLDCVIQTSTVVMRRRLLQKIGHFDEGLRRGQDYDYWLRASRITQIHSLSVALSAYRLHVTNSTWRPQPLNYGAMVLSRALRVWGREGPDGRVTPLPSIQRRLSDLWFTFGYQHMKKGSLSLAYDAAIRSIAAWPVRAKPWQLLAACVSTSFTRLRTTTAG